GIRDRNVTGVQTCALPICVRHFVNDLMGVAVRAGAYIAEGRDLGTVVFPDDDIKFFMSADLDERACRRYEEQKAENPELTLKEVRQSIEHRDYKDANRAAEPLNQAEDVIRIDTTNIAVEQQ